MEVHTHSHTERKKWHHYLWEFLMLFLAVFCGFLAENFREHQVEHQREKQYIKSLFFDLVADTAQLNSIENFRQQRVMEIDSVLVLLKSPQLKEKTSSFYLNAVFSQYNLKFTSQNGTLSQLKNAGGLRLIRKQNVVDSILHYDTQSQSLSDFEAWERERLNDQTTFSKVVDASVIEKNSVYTYPEYPYRYHRPEGNPPLLSYDKYDLEQLYNRFQLQKRLHAVTISMCDKLKWIAIALIELLRKEYHLE
jgi:hypothetical protein